MSDPLRCRLGWHHWINTWAGRQYCARCQHWYMPGRWTWKRVPVPVNRRQLRAQAQERASNRCEWPTCPRPGAELAHLHSIGMGGRPSADTLSNVAWLCHRHALASDGLYQARHEYVADLEALGVTARPGDRGVARKVAEKLASVIRHTWIGDE